MKIIKINNIGRPDHLKKKKPLPRGLTRGKKCGRGQTGQKAREKSGHVTGGQFPLYRKIRKVGFIRKNRHPDVIFKASQAIDLAEKLQKNSISLEDIRKMLNCKNNKGQVRVLLDLKQDEDHKSISIECHKCSPRVDKMFNIIKKNNAEHSESIPNTT